MVIIIGLFIVLLLSALNAVPLAFLSMLFLGNVGWNIGFLDLLPGAMAVHIIKNNVVTYTKGS